jgi:hypothetical protein
VVSGREESLPVDHGPLLDRSVRLRDAFPCWPPPHASPVDVPAAGEELEAVEAVAVAVVGSDAVTVER